MNAIELFGCAGGMAEGFRRAGIAFDLVFDYDPNACASYEANLGHRPIQMDVRDLVRMLDNGWRPMARLDLIVADPPCTPWSRAGKRQGLADERDMMRETIAVILALRPRAYLIGNVPGLDDGNNWGHVQDLLAPLADVGYCVADYARLDAANYGVPQHRVRPFWFGHRGGPCMIWPAPTHCAPGHLPGLGLSSWVTCRDALGHLPVGELGQPVRLRWRTNGDHRANSPDEPGKTMTTNANGDGALMLNNKHPVSRLDAPARTQVVGNGGWNGASTLAIDGDALLTRRLNPEELDPMPQWGRRRSQNGKNIYSRPDRPARVVGTSTLSDGNVLQVREGHRPVGPDEPVFTVTGGSHGGSDPCVTWPWDRPATTATRDERIPPPGHHDTGSYMSGQMAIKLSERARAILQGFPERWQFLGRTKRARSAQIGMAMPPPLAEAVARSVRFQLETWVAEVVNVCAV